MAADGGAATAREYLKESSLKAASVQYLQGQRWGSALPAPSAVGGRDAKGRGPTTVSVLDIEYEGGAPPLVYERPAATAGAEEATDYLADDALGLYYAGDFCSRRNPGFEAAALSGMAVAEHIARVVAAGM